jgi:hypothetical protein
MRDLLFFHDDNSLFADYTLDAREYLRDSFTINYTEAEDFIYIGLYKPFYQNYVEMVNPAAGLTLSVEYSTSAGWSTLNITDYTKNLSRSGFIKWDLETSNDWALSTVDNEEKYWVRIKLGIDFSLEVQGWNMVFSDDNDLLAEVRQINKYLAKGDSSFIAYHLSARDDILQDLRNGGNDIRPGTLNAPEFLTQWDLLKPEEIRQASKFLTLSKIFFDASSEIEDKDYQRYMDYKNDFGTAFKNYYRSLDNNDDGVLQDEEKSALRTITLNKV